MRSDPSGLSERLDAAERASLAVRIADSARIARTFSAGSDLIASPALPLAERELGDLVHDWFAEWAFVGAPSRDDIARHVRKRWGDAASPLVPFLEAVTERTRRGVALPWRIATADGAERHFELPLVGTVGLAGTSLLVAGRTDLLVREPSTGTWTVIDFKAGTHFPTDAADLEKGASLRTYGPQLEGYASAVNAALAASPWAGERVTRCVLWFVRAGAFVAWEPVGLTGI
jgi:ATP-dependent exoDNAse (exonuclease V) beta subunit